MSVDISGTSVWQRAQALCDALELELRRLKSWSDAPLTQSAFENMGAFGANTMRFEQWLQFVLVPKLRDIVSERGEFPAGTMLAAYASRVLDSNAVELHKLLARIDELINTAPELEPAEQQPPVAAEAASAPGEVSAQQGSQTITLGDTTLPSVVYTLLNVLPRHAFEDIESHLQTFDAFLDVLSPKVRARLADLLMKTAPQCSDVRCSARIETAARSIAWGRRAAEPYDHEQAMLRYIAAHRDDFRKSE